MELQLQDRLNRALGIFIESMRDYIPEILDKTGKKWDAAYYASLSPQHKDTWDRDIKKSTNPTTLIDFPNLKDFALAHREILRGDFEKDANKLPTWFQDIADARNKCYHHLEISDDEAIAAFTSMKRILSLLEFKDDAAEIEKLRTGEPQPKTVQSEKKATGLIPWFKNVTPHSDIRRGILDESIFAANLAEVSADNGREVYRNSSEFFAKTYITAGLKTVCTRVIKGLNGNEESDNRVISLQTGFGGGKTHTLISIYHLARMGKRAVQNPHVKSLIESIGTPEFETANVAVFTNTTNDPVQGRKTADGIVIRTLWGEIAYQLGGKALYEIIRKNDEERISPAGLMKQILEKAQPSLILIDELTDYCVKASGVKVEKTTLADQTISFVQELSEAVTQVKNAVMVATLPASEVEVAQSPQGALVLSNLSSRLSRVSADTKPVSGDEIYEVIRHRLFENLGNEQTMNAVVEEYIKMYKASPDQYPAEASKTEYRAKMLRSYPFHPELIDIFQTRWASNHDFQRTRGVLRILAAITADLYKRQGSLVGVNALIQSSDVNFTNVESVASQIKKLYGNGYEAVISADVSGGSSNAFKIDSEKSDYGSHNVTQGIAATILMGSFGTDGSNKGITIKEIKLNVCRPNAFNPMNVHGALDAISEVAHYLYASSLGSGNKHYWFHTKPNINILINQAKNDIDNETIKGQIRERIKSKTGNRGSIRVLVDPSDDIPELTEPTIIVVPSDIKISDGIDGLAKEYIEKRFLKRGNADRIYRNTMLFLFSTDVGSLKVNSAIKEYCACRRINDEYSTQLERDERDDLRRRIEERSRQVDSAIASAYSVLVKYRLKDEPKILKIAASMEVLDAQIESAVKEMKDAEWILSSVGINTFKSNNLYPSPDKPIRVKDAYEAFLRYNTAPMITGPDAVKVSLERYCTNGEIVIASGDGKNFTQMYYKKTVPFFSVTDESFWICDRTMYVEEKPAAATAGTEEGTGTTGPKQDPPPVIPGPKHFRTVTVSGSVSVDDYGQVFSSFIAPFAKRNNPVDIEISVRVSSLPGKELIETMPEIKNAEESAKQMKLRLHEEEI